MAFSVVKVFSSTMIRERLELGERVTRWLAAQPDLSVVEWQVRQSSDREFHCLTIVLFLEHRPPPTA